MAKHVRSREGSPRRGRIRRWLVKMGLVFDPSVPGNPRLDADNSIHEGRARASGFSDV